MTNTDRQIKSAIVTPDEILATSIAGLIANFDGAISIRTLLEYSDQANLERWLRFNGFHVMVVDCRQIEPAVDFITKVQAHPNSPEIVAVCDEDVSTLSRLMRLKVTDYVLPDLTPEQFEAALNRAIYSAAHKPSNRPPGEIISFLPVKPGAGASIVSSNTAGALARVAGTKTLLADFDLNSGMISFLLKINAGHTVRDALSNAHQMDENIWGRLKSECGSLDVLAADMGIGEAVQSERVVHLLDFFRDSYDATCIDLAGGFDSVSMDILRESRRIYLVSTQELACQHLLVRKAQILKSRGLEGEIKVIINRFDAQNVLTEKRIQELTGLPTETTIPNDYRQVSSQIHNGELFDPRTAAGKKFDALAASILRRQPTIVERKRRFIEYFSPSYCTELVMSVRG